MNRILVIQTAFIGDVVLATAIVEKLAMYFPGTQIDFLVRSGNESLLSNNPHINEVLVWIKKKKKYRNLFSVIKKIRKNKYDLVINLQRYFTTGLVTALSGAKEKRGFDKNPLSLFFTKKVKHIISAAPPYKHEVERNNELISDITDDSLSRPKMYPSQADFTKAEPYTHQPYVTLTPSSVWFTKQYPLQKWVELIDSLPSHLNIYLLGGKSNKEECETIAAAGKNKNTVVLAGEFSFLQSAALMKTAVMNFVNDSAPLHFCSAVNAPVTAIFCSTVPAFGFTPLADISFIVERLEPLYCRPCGLHGKKQCPEGHFKCGFEIKVEQLLQTLPA